MHVFVVAWLAASWDCPWGLGRLPQAAKLMVCTEHRAIETELYDPARRRDAERRLEQLGPGATATMLEIRGTRARTVPAAWTPVLTVGR